VTTILDPDCPAADIVRLYHDRWEIETAFLELKSTILGGRVLRAKTPTGVDQEIYALLVTYQALRTAIFDATLGRPDVDPDRGSFSIALNTARDQLVQAAGVIADTVIDLVGVIGRHTPGQPHARPATENHPPRGQTRDLKIRRQQRPRPVPRTQLQGHHQHRHPRPRRPLTNRPGT
jgi:Transposase DDE domain